MVQVWNSHHVRSASVPPAEIGRHGRPEPVGLSRLAGERLPAVVTRASRPQPPVAVRADREHRESSSVAGARPRHVEHRGVVVVRHGGHADVRHGNSRVARRAADPQVTDVLRPRVGVRAAPSIRVDRPAAVCVIHAEVEVWTGRGARHPGETDHLAPRNVLALRDVDPREMAVESQQAVAVVDLDRLAAEARVTAGDQPVGDGHAPRRGRGDRLVVKAVVIAVMTAVIQVVMAAGGLRKARVERRVWAADFGRSNGAVVAAKMVALVVVGIAVIEDRRDVMRTHERKGQERARGRADPGAPLPVLDRPIRDLARIRPA